MNIADSNHSMKDLELFKVLGENDARLALGFAVLANKRLKKSDEAFFDYTAHDVGHALRTLTAFNYILVNLDLIKSITDEEALISIGACLLHDVGMGPISAAELALAFKSGIADDTRMKWREKHHQRTSKWIANGEDSELMLLSKTTRKRMAKIAEGHRKINLIHDTYFRKNARDAFLAGILRLADQMDLSPSRVTDRLADGDVIARLLVEAESEKDKIQVREFLKSFASKEWYLLLDEDEPILFLTSKIPLDNLTLDSLAALNELTMDILEVIEHIKNIQWNDNYPLPRRLDYTFEIEGQATSRHVLRADFSRVWEYLNLYMYESEIRQAIAIREVIANAIDACKLRQGLQSRSSCNIMVEYREDELLVTDNGIGMSLEIIEDNLKTLGSSFYDSPRFKGSPEFQKTESIPIIGRFGIGVFSYFLACQMFEIISQRGPDEAHRILFYEKFGVTLKSNPSKRPKSGTSVRLIRPSQGGGFWNSPRTLEQILDRIFVRSPIPISLKTGRVRKQVGLTGLKKTNQVDHKTSSSSFGLANWMDTDDFEVGYKLEAQYRYDTFDETSIALLTLYHLFYKHWQRAPMNRNMIVNVLLEGMKLLKQNVMAPPFAMALCSLLEMPGIESQGYSFWVNMHADTLVPNLTKMEWEERPRNLDFALRTLDDLVQPVCIEIINDKQTPWMIRERIRWTVIRNLSSEWLSRNALNIDDSNLLSLISPLWCYDCNTNESITLNHVLKLSKSTPILFWPFGEDIRYFVEEEDWNYIKILHTIDRLKRRTRFESTARRISRNAKREGKHFNRDTHFYLLPFGHTVYGGCLDFFKLAFKQLGFANIMTHDDTKRFRF